MVKETKAKLEKTPTIGSQLLTHGLVGVVLWFALQQGHVTCEVSTKQIERTVVSRGTV